MVPSAAGRQSDVPGRWRQTLQVCNSAYICADCKSFSPSCTTLLYL